MSYLNEQIITYLGNKRKLLPLILQATEPKNKVCLDLFSGSGIVARLFKENGASKVIANDLENYSRIINQCYLANPEDYDMYKYEIERKEILYAPLITDGPIYTNYAPHSENIQEGDRCFYTPENAVFIDSNREAIKHFVSPELQPFFIAPLLYEASVHANTSGVFKGFYKNKKGIGQWGGEGQNALDRICKKINIELRPIFSSKYCETQVLQQDATSMPIISCDVAYLDPPYNQHPYGSNYFMLNLIANGSWPQEMSKVSGIPKEWNKSDFNKKHEALAAMRKTLGNIKASDRIVVSYNNEGFISYEQMFELLSTYGEVSILSEEYLTFRGCRNLSSRDIHTTEYLFIVR